MEIIKHKEGYIQQKYFFVKGKLNIKNQMYFLQKIEEGISKQDNQSWKTNVSGEMTSWQYFINDPEFNKLIIQIYDYVEEENLIPKNCAVIDAWGLKCTFGSKTKRHNHVLKNRALAGVIYLCKVDHPLIFDEINEKVEVELGSFALFSSYLYHKNINSLKFNEFKYALSFNLIKNT
jgi:hypothetical protein